MLYYTKRISQIIVTFRLKTNINRFFSLSLSMFSVSLQVCKPLNTFNYLCLLKSNWNKMVDGYSSFSHMLKTKQCWKCKICMTILTLWAILLIVGQHELWTIFYGICTERMIKGGKYKQFRSIFEHIAGILFVTAVGRCWNSAIFLLTKND